MKGPSNTHHRTLGGLLLFTFVVAVLLRLPGLISTALSNASLVVLAKSSSCSQSELPCHSNPLFEGNQVQLDQAKMLLETALKWQPNSSMIRLHLAMVYFGLGLRNEAASMAAPLKSYPAGCSPLVPVGLPRERNEYYLVHAQQMAGAGRWAEAVRDFRLGLAWGGDQILPIDLQDFYTALSNFYQEQAQTDPTSARLVYLVGKYLYRGEHWSEALPWLKRSTSISGVGSLTSEETGWAYVTMGQALEAQGNLVEARKAFEQAVGQSPNLREAYVYLTHLLRIQGEKSMAGQVDAQLAALGPGTILGRQAVNYQVKSPLTLPSGWTLVGYDLDEESLENGGPIKMLLWWQNQEGVDRAGDTWTQAGSYWLEWRTVTNMFPNAGFEWGTRQDGIPLGHKGELYGASPGSLEVKSVLRNGVETNTLFANNNAQNPNVSLVSYPSQVDPAGYYLMAGWFWDETGNALIGRNCWWNGGGGPYYITYYDREPHRPLNTWVQVADLNVAFPDQQAENGCEVLLNNYNTITSAAWDDILWVPISSP